MQHVNNYNIINKFTVSFDVCSLFTNLPLDEALNLIKNNPKGIIWVIFFFFFYANHPLQGFRSHCSVRGYSSLLVATAGAEATTRTGRQHTHVHTHTHTQPPTQPFITSKDDMKSLLVREQVDGSTVLSTKTKYIQGHSTKLLLPEGTMV